MINSFKERLEILKKRIKQKQANERLYIENKRELWHTKNIAHLMSFSNIDISGNKFLKFCETARQVGFRQGLKDGIAWGFIVGVIIGAIVGVTI